MHVSTWSSWFFLACVWAVAAAAGSDNSGIVEVDLVFPRNETYEPTTLFPLVFAFQNSHLASSLNSEIVLSISDWNNESEPTLTTSYQMIWANFSSNDPYFVYRGFTRFNTEGTWLITWTLEWLRCTEDSLSWPYPFSNNHSRNSIIFTTKNSGRKVDLVAATNSNDCPKDRGVTVNVTGTLNTSSMTGWKGNGMCAMAASSTATPDPCRVKISSAVESSIYAAVTGLACRAAEPPVDCPSDDKGGESTAQKLVIGGLVCLAAALGAVFHILV